MKMNHLKKAEDLPSRVFKGAVNMCFRSLSTDTYFFTMSYLSLSIRVKREYESARAAAKWQKIKCLRASLGKKMLFRVIPYVITLSLSPSHALAP